MTALSLRAHRLFNLFGKNAVQFGLTFANGFFNGQYCIVLFGEPKFPEE